MADKNQAAILHEALLDRLRKQGVFQTPGVEAAFRAVPRHLFLPELSLESAYADEAQPLAYDTAGLVVSSASQPTMMAIMLDQLQLRPGANVLEIGTASGYNAALMQHIVGPKGHITSLELDKNLAQQARINLSHAAMSSVTVVEADGVHGYSPRASYDAIIVTAGVWDVPDAWVRQLKPNGRLVMPLMLDGIQVSANFILHPDGTLYSDDNRPCAFVFMRGDSAAPRTRKQIGSTGLYLLADEVEKVDAVALQMLLSDDHDTCRLETRLKATDYWYGFQMHLMLNEPSPFIFAVFAVVEGQRAFGMEGRGIALMGPGGACLAPYDEMGNTHCFGGVDAFLAMQESLDEWQLKGSPRTPEMCIRLVPRTMGRPADEPGKVYDRPNHYVHAWMEARHDHA